MKRRIITAALLVMATSVFAQNKPATTDNNKWGIRLRAIAAVPQASSYNLSGSDVKISTSVVPELDFTYYFSKNIGAELILGTTHHKVSVDNKTTNTELGKVWLLPPTLNLQYHVAKGSFLPYIGAGINYTIFYGAKDVNASLAYKNKAAFSTQLGFDYKLNSKWFLNVDVKKIFLKTDVTVKGTQPTVLNDVKINPFVFGIGIGTRL